MIQLKYLVVGTGRCGTVNLAMTLASVGIPCSHERFFTGNSLDDAIARLQEHGGCNSYCSKDAGLDPQGDDIQAEASYLAAPYLDEPFFEKTIIIHVVRHPLKVILSFLNDIGFFLCGPADHPHESFVYRHAPGLRNIANPIDRAVRFYIEWNNMIEERGRCRNLIFHRIEDGPSTLLQKLHFSLADAAHCYQNPRCNTWRFKTDKYSPQDILQSAFSKELSELAVKYGYPTLNPHRRLPGMPHERDTMNSSRHVLTATTVR
jgi:hypothetical protein